jgi:hypothetical protein
MSAPYEPPVSQLLSLGEVGFGDSWLDSAALGITPAHVPELIRLLLDEDLYWASSESAEAWATIHAWRALGQLGAVDAISPLLELLGWDDDADWALEEIPRVLGMIGLAALEPARAALARLARDDKTWAAGAAATALVEIAKGFPDQRGTVVAAIQHQLRWWARQGPDVNALLVGALVDLTAVEAAPLIEEAFSRGAVDETFIGDWEDVQIELGLLAERVTPRPWYGIGPPPGMAHVWRRGLLPEPPGTSRDPAALAKRRRKAEKAARQRNRKRKKR